MNPHVLPNTRRRHHPRLEKLTNILLVVIGLWFGLGAISFFAHPVAKPNYIDFQVRWVVKTIADTIEKD